MRTILTIAFAGAAAAQSVTVALSSGVTTTLVLPAWPGNTVTDTVVIPAATTTVAVIPGGSPVTTLSLPGPTVTNVISAGLTTTTVTASSIATATVIGATTSTVTTLTLPTTISTTISKAPNATATKPSTVITAGAGRISLQESAVGLIGFVVMGLVLL